MDPRRTTMRRIRDRLSVSKRGNSPMSPSPEAVPIDWEIGGGTGLSMESNRPGHSRSPSFFDRVLRVVHPGPATPSLVQNPDYLGPEFRLVASSEFVVDPPGQNILTGPNFQDISEKQASPLETSQSDLAFPLTDEQHPLANDVPQGSGSHTMPNLPRDFKHIAHNTLRLSLALLEKVSESFPIPGVKGILGGINMMIDRFDKTSQNAQDMDILLETFTSLSDILSKFQNTKSSLGHVMTTELKAQIAVLSETISETKDETEVQKLKDELLMLQSKSHDSEDAGSDQIKQVLENLANAKRKVENTRKHGRVRKVVDAHDDAQLIADQYRRLEGSINEILVGSVLRAEAKLAEQQAFELLAGLPRAKNARYDYVGRPRCSPGTREGVLKEIGGWVSEDREHQIYWLNGGAGTGKTTVALTLAHSIETASTALGTTGFSNEGMLSASFFCSRDNSDRSNIHYIFPTLSYLLAQRDTAFRNELARIIKDSPDIAHAPPDQQCSQLLIEPLKAVNTNRPIMIILDALDECVDPRCPETILTSLASRIKEVNSLKVFVSSRPTSSTNDAFADDELRKLRAVFVLHDVEGDVVKSDIKNYITSRLRAKARLRKVDIDDWPPEHHVDMLVDKAAGLFIYASTVCEFIERPGNLPFMLQPIAEAPATGYTGVDALYRQLLNSAIQNMEESSIEEVRLIINTIVRLQNPLSSEDLGGLLGYPPLQIQGRLGDLQPVLVVPEKLEEHVRTFHASFHDYLADERRCLPRMYVSASSHHKHITTQALKSMQTLLKKDICGIGSKFKAEFSDLELQDLHKRFIPGHLNYACKHWVDHLCFVLTTDQDVELLQALDEFASTTLLFWVEALSFIGIVNTTLAIFERIRSWYDSQSLPIVSTFKELLDDAILLLPQYIPAINECPSQVYASVLPFMNPDRRLRSTYLASSYPTVSMSSEIFPGVNCICYSPDGSKVISGLMDGTVNFWEPTTAVITETWKAHSKAVLALAYSPNGETLASTSSEGTLKIWDAQTRQLQSTIDLPAERTNTRRPDFRASLAFSADNDLLAFTSPNSRHIWDTKKWKEKRFTGQGGGVVCGGNWVALSPDRTCFAVADNHGIYVVDLNGLRYIVRDQLIHSHLVFSEDSTLIRSTQGTYSIAMADPVDTRVYRERFPKDLYLHGAWLINLDGKRCCWVPEIHRKGDFYATCKNKIVFGGNDRLTFVEVLSDEE